jgi:hypothetical protein
MLVFREALSADRQGEERREKRLMSIVLMKNISSLFSIFFFLCSQYFYFKNSNIPQAP